MYNCVSIAFFVFFSGSEYMPDEELLDMAYLTDEPAEPEPVAGSSTAPQKPTPATLHASQRGRKEGSQRRKRGDVPLWRLVNDANNAMDIPEWLGDIEPATTLSDPKEYFCMFFLLISCSIL